MKRSIRTFLLAVAPVSFLHAAESALWDTANNKVTYSTYVENITLGTTAKQITLSQFSASSVADQNGNVHNASYYTLSKVVLTIDGTIYGSIWFQNNDPVETVSPSFNVANGSAKLTFGGYATGSEIFDQPVELGAVPAQTRIDRNVNVPGGGAVSTADITDDLAAFIGDGQITTFATIRGSGYFESAGNLWTGNVSLSGAANVSVTYEYVPEPSTLTLLGVGCVALLTRRRFKHPMGKAQGLPSSIA